MWQPIKGKEKDAIEKEHETLFKDEREAKAKGQRWKAGGLNT